jgi:hypothetical protein
MENSDWYRRHFAGTPKGIVVKRRKYRHANKFLAALQPCEVHWDGKIDEWAFRGHGCGSWQLVPSAFRQHAFRDLVPAIPYSDIDTSCKQQIFCELHAAKHFLRELSLLGLLSDADHAAWLHPRAFGSAVNRAMRLGTAGKEKVFDRAGYPTEALLPGLSIAQHYGIPTRLLDWSLSPMTAAYFAASSAQTGSGNGPDWLDVWALRYRWISMQTGLMYYPRCYSPPTLMNPHLRAQLGVFTYTSEYGNGRPQGWGRFNDQRPLDEQLTAIPAGESNGNLPILYRFSLLKSQAENLLRLLVQAGYGARAAFPSHSGAAASVREKARLGLLRLDPGIGGT